jgi:polygalacturonase
MGDDQMHQRINRRALLKFSAVAGGALVLPSWPAAASATASTSASATASATASAAARRPDEVDRAADRIVAGVRRPRIPPLSVPVTAFGAVGDGNTDCTTAFRRAIAWVHALGGGHVVVPPGTFATGPIHLLSHVDLHLAKGSRIAFSTDPNAYLPAVFTRWQGIEFMGYSPLIYAFGQHDIAVTGEGTLDGQASTANWWAWKPLGDQDFPTLEASANAGVPVTERAFATGFHFRPPLLQPYRCDRVLIEGVTVVNTPFWQLNPVLSTNVTVSGVTVDSAGPNNDGCDPECCDGVVITGCSFNTGDDCIAIKSGRNTDGRRVNVPCQNIVIQRSTFANGHGGVTIGSEMTGGVQQVYARDLTMNSPTLQSGHRIKTNSVRGGTVRDIHVRRVTAGTIGGPMLLIDYNYGEGNTGTFPPTVTDIDLADWTVQSCAQAWSITGYPDDQVGTVTLSDIAITTMTGGNSAQFVSDLVLRNVTCTASEPGGGC